MTKNEQVSLFGENKGRVEVKKHSALIAMDNTMTTFQQSKSINALLYIAKDQLKRNPNQTRFSTQLNIVKRMGGIARNDNRHLKKSLKALVSLIIEYNILKKDKKVRGAFPFLSFVQIEGGVAGHTAVITFELANPILEAVKHPNMYANLDLLILRELCEYKYGYLLYQVLKDYINLWKKSIGIESFRKLMGVPNGKYSGFNMLQKRVIDSAVEAINEKTPIKVSYELERKGRKVMEITFLIEWHFKQITKEGVNSEITQKLKDFGIRDNQIKKVFKNHDDDYILANIAFVEEQLNKGKKIRNVAAYLMKAFEVDLRPSKPKGITEQKLIRVEEDKEKWELAILKVNYTKEREAKLDAVISKLQKIELAELKGEFEQKILDTNFHSNIYKTKWFDYHAIQVERKKFLALKFLTSEYHSFENYRASQV